MLFTLYVHEPCKEEVVWMLFTLYVQEPCKEEVVWMLFTLYVHEPCKEEVVWMLFILYVHEPCRRGWVESRVCPPGHQGISDGSLHIVSHSSLAVHQQYTDLQLVKSNRTFGEEKILRCLTARGLRLSIPMGDVLQFFYQFDQTLYQIL